MDSILDNKELNELIDQVQNGTFEWDLAIFDDVPSDDDFLNAYCDEKFKPQSATINENKTEKVENLVVQSESSLAKIEVKGLINVKEKDSEETDFVKNEVYELLEPAQLLEPAHKMRNVPHISDLFRDLLKNKSEYVFWLNKNKGIFKINEVDKENIAKEWGKKKNNKNMNYDTMSRGFRHARKTGGYLSVLSKDDQKKFGKKFVLQFSLKAKINCNWLKSIMT